MCAYRIAVEAFLQLRYDDIAEQLATREFGKLAAKLRRMRRLDVGYWVCAFCVNQHSGICASPPPTDSTGHAIAACSCHVPKIFEGDPCEMNKFDDMMAFMKKALRKQGRARLEQVVALEPDFSLLTRASAQVLTAGPSICFLRVRGTGIVVVVVVVVAVAIAVAVAASLRGVGVGVGVGAGVGVE